MSKRHLWHSVIFPQGFLLPSNVSQLLIASELVFSCHGQPPPAPLSIALCDLLCSNQVLCNSWIVHQSILVFLFLFLSFSFSACNCNGKSSECYFDSELYRATGRGGHCRNCADNFDGPNCERCLDNYYRESSGSRCLPCSCNSVGEWPLLALSHHATPRRPFLSWSQIPHTFPQVAWSWALLFLVLLTCLYF